MINTLSQEDIDIYSSDPSGVKEQPGSPFYSEGVDVGYTAPAKWWNWLWNIITTIFTNGKADRQNVLTELTNALSSASIVPDSSNNKQLSKAVNVLCYNTAEAYDNEEVTEEIDGVLVTHKANQPYVVGHKLYIPDTELL